MGPCYYPGHWAVARQMFDTIWWLLRTRTRALPASGVAVVVLDAIRSYESLFDVDTLRSIDRTVRWAEERGHRVVYTRWVRTREMSDAGDSIDAKGHWTFYVPPGTSESLVSDAYHIPTRFTNAFSHEAFQEAVGDCTSLVLTGAWTESCVINTARAAVERGFDVTVLRPACTGHRMSRWVSLFTLQDMYATVVDHIL